MADYTYTATVTGYHWNLLQLIGNTIGVEPTGCSTSSNVLTIHFAANLTAPQKAQLDTIIAGGNLGQPPVPIGTRFKVKDIWEWRASLEASIGIPFKIYYSESVPGSGKFDMIELRFSSALTNAQKNTVKNEYANLIAEV